MDLSPFTENPVAVYAGFVSADGKTLSRSANLGELNVLYWENAQEKQRRLALLAALN